MTDALEWPENNNIDNIMPLSDCVEYIPGASLSQLQNWATGVNNGFPEPAEILGKYKLYDVNEVFRWVVLWRKVTKNMGRGDELNGKRSDS